MLSDGPLVGRVEELDVISTAMTRSADRASGIVIAGSAGVGKTRLARHAIALHPAAAGHRWVVGSASARAVPLGAFIDVVSDFGPDPLRRVREVIAGLVGDGAREGDPVIGCDDAHLLDDLSAFTVHQLVSRRLATVVVTIRSGESVPDAVTGLWKDGLLDRLDLQPLSLEEITELAEHVLGGPIESLTGRRLFRFTQGNALYLHHLLHNEVAEGRIVERSGVWIWDGRPALSPTLTDLLTTRLAHVPATIRDVIDTLAIAEPLDVEVLGSVVGTDALVDAEALGMITVDTSTRPASVRLAHPMLGEVGGAASLRGSQLRSRIAEELGRRPSTDPRDLIRRAVLVLDSDTAPDADLLLAAAAAALQLSDLELAETLAGHAAAAGGGPPARIMETMAIVWQERGAEADPILADLAAGTDGPVRTQLTVLRALYHTASLGDAAAAESLLDAVESAADPLPVVRALRALIEVVRGRSTEAVERAEAALPATADDPVARMVTCWTLVTGLGDLGRLHELAEAADTGYRLAEQSAEVSHLRMPLAALHGIANRLNGDLAALADVTARIRRDTIDVPFQQVWHGFFVGLEEMSRGRVELARRGLRDTLAHLEAGGTGQMTRGFARTWLATTTAILGDAAAARAELEAIEWWTANPDSVEWDSEVAIAHAWVCAAEGDVPQAVSILREAAGRERALGRVAWEISLLQTATQFGDDTTAERLAELADAGEGPRGPAAATHARALAARDGAGLRTASRGYQDFGDMVAAADAAAHAVAAYHDAGMLGEALRATAVADGLFATGCPGADTPARRAMSRQHSFTERQQEIISLAAQGMSNKQIAAALTMSVRSVEGHLFRACQRVGATGRDQLVAILTGSPTAPPTTG